MANLLGKEREDAKKTLTSLKELKENLIKRNSHSLHQRSLLQRRNHKRKRPNPISGQGRLQVRRAKPISTVSEKTKPNFNCMLKETKPIFRKQQRPTLSEKTYPFSLLFLKSENINRIRPNLGLTNLGLKKLQFPPISDFLVSLAT